MNIFIYANAYIYIRYMNIFIYALYKYIITYMYIFENHNRKCMQLIY